MAELHISSQIIAGVSTVTLSGEFDSHSAPRVRVLLEELTAEMDPQIRIHLVGLEYIDSTGLGVLVAALKQATDHKGRLELIALHPLWYGSCILPAWTSCFRSLPKLFRQCRPIRSHFHVTLLWRKHLSCDLTALPRAFSAA